MDRRGIGCVACGLVILLVSIGCGRAPASGTIRPAVRTVRIAIPSFDTDFLPFSFGQAKGFYAQRGYSVHLEVMKAPLELPALLSHKVSFIGTCSTALESAWEGVPVRMVFNGVSHTQDALIVRPSIHTPSDLRGKSIASNSTANLTAQLTMAALQHFGIKPQQITFVGAGASSGRLAALEAGSVSAAILEPGPAQEAIAKGMHRLFTIGDVVHVPLSGLAATTTHIRRHAREIRTIIAVTLRSMAYIKAHPKQLTRYIGKIFKLTPALAKAAYRAAIRSYNYTGRPTAASIRSILAIGQAFAARAGIHGKKSARSYPPVPRRLSSAQIARLTDFRFLPST